jgi:steroid delta-isomerase-like uncharacterized protein
MGINAGGLGEQSAWTSYMDAWTAHDAAAVVGYMTDDVVYIDLGVGERMDGRSAMSDFIASMQPNFSSDYRFDLGRVLIDGDSFAAEWTMSGTHDGEDEQRGLPATGRRSEIPGVSVGRLRDGKIAENKDYYNLASFLMQVGLMPAPETASAPST